ncbi:MAG TPA: hypothetical protein VGM20_13340 [Gemmatimonadales bacterium]
MPKGRGEMEAAYRHFITQRHARVGVVGDPETATEAWLILHGYGMLARGILHWFRSAARPGRVLIAPEGLSRFYNELSEGKRAVGASWTTREELHHEIEDQRQYLDQVVTALVPPDAALHIHGFSQGCSVAARWSIAPARPVAQLVCWAGAIPDDVHGAALRETLGPQPLHLVVGDRDARVPPERVESDGQRLRGEGLDVVVHHFEGGHTIDRALLSTFAG